MIHFLNYSSPLRRQTAALFGFVAVLVLVSRASAVDLDFNVANGNYNVAGNWIDPLTGVPPASPPGIADRAFIRNNGTVTINSDVQNLQMRIGYVNVLTAPDYNGDGLVDAADYVVWRKGGPLLNDATPDTVGPEDYTFWRALFGSPSGVQNVGRPGTLNWTAGEITGQGPIGGDPYSGGPDIRVGRVELVNGVPTEVTGTVVQNGLTTKLLLPYQQSILTIGDGTSSVNAPTSSYTLMNGTIGLGIGSTVFQNNGTNGNNGINVRNGTFTMTGGQIIDATPADYLNFALTTQRFLTVATATGVGVGSETVSTANLSGGTINVLGGIRVATANHSRGYLNISGTANITTGGDTSIGYQPTTLGTNAVGEMNMSAGSFQVGRTDIPNQTSTGLTGRFQIGDRGKGILNMSGGSITVTRNIRVANQFAAGGSIINMTGGTITTGGLEMRVDPNPGAGIDDGASIVLDGPTAVFTHLGTGPSTGVTIGNQGKALFEVRQGHATLGGNNVTTQLGANATSAATLNVMGGKLTLVGPLGRSNTASVAPVIGLTGGILEFNAAASGQLWQTDFTNTGSQLITKTGALHQVTVGDSTHTSDFSMSGGSWNIEIGSNVTATGADRFIVANTTTDLETASLTGGTLNISYISGYTPAVNDTLRILQGPDGVTLNAGAVTLAGNPGWSLITDITNTQIQLKYVGPGAGGAVPEPSTIVLVGLLASVAMAWRRPRCI